MVDIVSTLPTLIWNQAKSVYWLKMLRLSHARQAYGAVSEIIKFLLQKAGLNKGSVEKLLNILNLLIYLFSAIHILCCIWIYVGKITECSWVNYCSKNGQIEFDYQESYPIYVMSFYWVITTLTTVGYGDFKGYTPIEYIIQMIVEFLGIAVFSYLMGSINSMVGSECTLQDIIDERMENIEMWLRKLEKSRSKNFSKQLYDCIKDYTEKSYKYDFCKITKDEFFVQLKPRVRHRLNSALFGNFVTNFFYLFNDQEFEGGCEFQSDFLSNMYSRLYLPENDIIQYGDEFSELVMIQDGVVSISLNLDQRRDTTFGAYGDRKESSQFEFFVLPTYSFFGDYQILYNLKSQLIFTAGEGKLLITMCLKKQKLLEMMDNYPEARSFYMERAWSRRSEFRRRQKKFVTKLVEAYVLLDADNSVQMALDLESKKAQ